MKIKPELLEPNGYKGVSSELCDIVIKFIPFCQDSFIPFQSVPFNPILSYSYPISVLLFYSFLSSLFNSLIMILLKQ